MRQVRQTLAVTLCCFLLNLASGTGQAWYPRQEEEALLPPDLAAPVIGANRSYVLGAGETLIDLAYRSGLGYQSLVVANPGVDPWIPAAGTPVLLPYSAILPPGSGPGITINLAEYRLYLLWQQDGRRFVRIYPIGIGSEGAETREGLYEVTGVVRNPTWSVPPSIRAERPGMPAVVAPGPENPLGEYWIGLSLERTGIHGTNKPFGVGRRVSHGCIRLYAQDIEDLARRVQKGTPVRIIYQPVKVGVRGKRLMAEIHPDFLKRLENGIDEVLRQEKRLNWKGKMDWQALQTILLEAKGIPLPVSEP